ncbi:MAG TPA: hypothetical protein DCP11_12660 [Microbacteriaceae bacterium]|nr:hypothetical protein [Microbacteriaceae bacterium]
MTKDAVEIREPETSGMDGLFASSGIESDRPRASLAVQLAGGIAAIAALCVVAVFVISVAAPVLVEVLATLLTRFAAGGAF